MARIVNNSLSLNLFRKREAPRAPLHARWGDVAITVPTDGSWCQFDNPHHHHHKGRQQKLSYGPGFVPDCSEDDHSSFSSPSSDDDGYDDGDEAVLTKTKAKTKNEHTATTTTAGSKRHTFSIPILKPRGRRLFSTGSVTGSLRQHAHTATSSDKDKENCGHGGGGFVYKPVVDKNYYYTEEPERKRDSGYSRDTVLIPTIPASKKRLEGEVVSVRRARIDSTSTSTSTSTTRRSGHSAEPSIDSVVLQQMQDHWDFIDDDDDENDHDHRKSARPSKSIPSGQFVSEKTKKKPSKQLPSANQKQMSRVRSRLFQGHVSEKEEKTRGKDRKKKQKRVSTMSSRPVIVTMVSDPEDLYG